MFQTSLPPKMFWMFQTPTHWPPSWMVVPLEPKKWWLQDPFFLFFPGRGPLWLEKIRQKKIRDDEGNGQLFCFDFLSFCDVSILEKIDKK